MNYVSWAAMYEGSSDRSYFDVLIPRAIEWLALRHGTGITEVASYPVERFRRATPQIFAQQACQAASAFGICFIHGDTGGRALEAGIDRRTASYCRAMNRACQWPMARCVVVTPRKEMEAWVLADRMAVAGALGYSDPARIQGLPINARQAETLNDPKASLQAILASAGRRRRPLAAEDILPAVALRQDFDVMLGAQSFTNFISALQLALADIRVVG